MPTFKPKPYALQGHHVRFEDVFSEEPDQPDWLYTAFEEGRVEVSPRPEGLYVEASNPAAPRQFAALGDWILLSADESLRVVTAAELAAEYDLVG